MLAQKALVIGVPIVIIDWKAGDINPLAALCASAPDIVQELYSSEAASHAEALEAVAADAIGRLRRDLQTWALGFESLRSLSHDQILNIWTSPRAAAAALNKDTAGGATPKLVARRSVSAALDAWWSGQAANDAPIAVLGPDGVGKTWASLAWLIDHSDIQPIVLVIASSTAKELGSAPKLSVKRFIASRLSELSGGVRDEGHWLRRLDRLLKRPIEEGPVLTVLFDGMNQEPSVPWIPLLKTLQDDPFAGRVRVIVGTRDWHYEEKLGCLRGLIVQPSIARVCVYDDAPEGELDQRLLLDGLTRNQLHPDLLDLARTPRLFDLVVRLKDRLVGANEITLHRLLWEYGRDARGERAGVSFSEEDWRAWLSEIAERYRDGARYFSIRMLAETASRPGLSDSEVFARLSDIIDGQFTTLGHGGVRRFKPDVVAHALGAALLAQLSECQDMHFDAVDAELAHWLDPVAALDQRAEILRASISILVEQGLPDASPLAGALVTAWLQTQNLPDGHRRELAGLAVRLPNALLDAIEHSAGYAQASARLWAVNALRAIPREPGEVLDSLVARARTWLSEVSRDVRPASQTSEDFERHRSARFTERVGVDVSGPIRAAAVDLCLVDISDGAVAQTIPSILEGFPLAKALTAFETAAVAMAVSGQSPFWDGIRWLCLLNEVDPMPTAIALRALSASITVRPAECGVNPDLPAKAASLLLWLTGDEADERAASVIGRDLQRFHTYDNDYLPDPARSLFPLERRHAIGVLLDTSLPLLSRVSRTSQLWLDPSFEPPETFTEEVRALASFFAGTKLDRSPGRTIEDYNFEILELPLARCAPELLAEIVRAKLCEANIPPDSRYLRAIKAPAHLVLAGAAEAIAARVLRLSSRETESGNELYASSQLLLVELHSALGERQIKTIMEAEIEHILLEHFNVQKPITQAQAEALVAQYGTDISHQRKLISLLIMSAPIEKSEALWDWLIGIGDSAPGELRGLAFRVLADGDGLRLGRHLLSQGWSWSPSGDYWMNHYGSGALIQATLARPFDQVAPRLAPWRLLEAARTRGEDPFEVRLAASILSTVLAADGLSAPDPGAVLTIDRTVEGAGPVNFSIEPFELENNSGNIRHAMDAGAQQDAWERAFKTAIDRINDARAQGASLYLANVDVEDMVPVLRHTPDLVDLWLEGAADRTIDFRRRATLAEWAFLALCEALLHHDPDRGAVLWRQLKRTMTTRFVGKAKVDDMIQMVFRVPNSPAVAVLRAELLSLEYSNSDKDLFDLAIAASLNGQGQWLAAAIAKDASSPLAWQRKRAAILEGFTTENVLPQPMAWPDGPLRTDWDDLRRRSALFRYREACAHHWWRCYLAAPDAVSAYSAWILFMRSADRRALAWTRRDADSADCPDAFFKLKMTHAAVNSGRLNEWMEKQEDKLDTKFLGRTVQNGIGPWGKVIT